MLARSSGAFRTALSTAAKLAVPARAAAAAATSAAPTKVSTVRTADVAASAGVAASPRFFSTTAPVAPAAPAAVAAPAAPVAPAAALTDATVTGAAAAGKDAAPAPKLSLRERWRASRAEKRFRNFFPRNFYRYTAFSFGGLYTLNAFTDHFVNLLRDMHAPSSVLESAIYYEGALHALAAAALVKFGAYVLSLGGKPSERVIQEIMYACLERPAVKEALGDNVRAGSLATYAYTDNSLRFFNSRRREVQRWQELASLGTLTEPVPVPLWRRIFRRAARPAPATAVAGVDDVNVSVTQKLSDLNPALPGAPAELTAAATAAAAAPATAAAAAAAPAATAGALPAGLQARVSEALDRSKDRADYNGWGRLWKARRLQIVMHVVGDTDSALLLAEVEKKHTGWSDLFQGFTEYRTFQLVSLTTGKTLSLQGPEQAALIGNAKLSQLFTTIPAQQENPYL